MTREFLGALGLALAALLPIINPIGGSPIFLSMTPGASAETRLAMARRVAVNCTLLLIAAMVGGSYLLNFLGLSLPVIKIAGGLLVVANGWRLLNAEDSRSQNPDAKLVSAAPVWNRTEIETRSFFPLTFPLTVGPGSISVAITIGADTRAPGALPLAAQMAGVLVGVLMAGLAIYLSYRYAARVVQLLGETGSVVLLRLSAFLLLSIGVQILTDGIVERFHLERFIG